MPPTVEDRLRDILESIAEIESLINGADFRRFSSDRMLCLAVERLLEIVCEASRNIPDSLKAAEPDIDWRRIIDFGNVLRHAYHTTNVDIVWDIILVHLPPLKSFAERHVSKPS